MNIDQIQIGKKVTIFTGYSYEVTDIDVDNQLVYCGDCKYRVKDILLSETILTPEQMAGVERAGINYIELCHATLPIDKIILIRSLKYTGYTLNIYVAPSFMDVEKVKEHLKLIGHSEVVYYKGIFQATSYDKYY